MTKLLTKALAQRLFSPPASSSKGVGDLQRRDRGDIALQKRSKHEQSMAEVLQL